MLDRLLELGLFTLLYRIFILFGLIFDDMHLVQETLVGLHSLISLHYLEFCSFRLLIHCLPRLI